MLLLLRAAMFGFLLVPEHSLCIRQGQPWSSAIAGHEINPVQAENDKQRLLLERFQEEVNLLVASSFLHAQSLYRVSI
jgi:hypothetical protein